MKILFCGVIEKPWQSGSQRLKALEQIGHEIIRVSSAQAQAEPRLLAYSRRFLPCAAYEMLLSSNEAKMHTAILEAASGAQPDAIWLEWPRMVGPKTLEALKKRFPKVPIISYQDDNPFGTRRFADYGWHRFFSAMPLYDGHLVKRDTDVPEYAKRGAKNIKVFLYGYADDVFYPDPTNDPSMTHDVVFVGTALDQRVTVLDELTGKLATPVHIYGARWDRTPLQADRSRLLNGPLNEVGYRHVVSNAKISLGFVSHSNLDLYTYRTFEVPACGTMFLGESTTMHKELYRENVEAVFFESTEECRDKIRYYLAHDSEREKIAEAGRKKAAECYVLKRRMSEVVEFIEQVRSGL